MQPLLPPAAGPAPSGDGFGQGTNDFDDANRRQPGIFSIAAPASLARSTPSFTSFRPLFMLGIDRSGLCLMPAIIWPDLADGLAGPLGQLCALQSATTAKLRPVSPAARRLDGAR